MARTKSEWKSISKYADVDGIEERVRNREAFSRFVREFRWQEYQFQPTPVDFQKFMAGRDDYNVKNHLALGFARLPDKSLNDFGFARGFRSGKDVMLVVISRDIDHKRVRLWAENHNLTYVFCKPERAFHDNGFGQMVFFMTESVRKKYDKILQDYIM